MSLHEGPDLQVERNGVDRFLRRVTFALDDGSLEIFENMLFLSNNFALLSHLGVEAGGVLGLVEGFSEGGR